MDVRIRTLEADEALACLGPVVIRVVDGAKTTTATIDALRVAVDELLQRWPLVGLWVIVHHDSPFPDAEVRRHADAVLGPDSEKQCLVYSLLGLGFWATTAIAVSKLLSKMARQPALIETTVEAGAQRLAMEMIGVDPHELVAAHDELLRRMKLDAVA